ncbi:amino acid adenylation protein [Cupriavidus basilensis OR16]|uniref:Amino acid adenylation protein n=1 Tax=Cupriavidus basilensis OR16 TaxID=1127483 RepID=H1RY10_9BURK|nr:amino acid adenylation protein [Cupriavidus basilensis OR16]
MSGRFSGAADLTAFWDNLCAGQEGRQVYSRDTLLANGVAPVVLDDPAYVKAGMPMADIDCFDAEFFTISAKQATWMDPQIRLFLEVCWHAMEDAGYDVTRLGKKLRSHNLAQWLEVLTGNDKDYLSTWVAYKLGLRGPSLNIQTACSTSLVSVATACHNLLAYQCDMALAGAAALTLPHGQGYLYQANTILSPDGHCRPFDADAAGTVMGNGVAAVVLKRFEDAIRDGDHIDALILSAAVNNDAQRKMDFMAPGIEGQAEVIRMAHRLAEVTPESIDYVEAHGTGTRLGDPIEFRALQLAFGAGQHRARPCAIGAVKGNLGHLNTAAGMAGLIKTVLALRHEMLPPTLHYRSPNPQLALDDGQFFVNDQLRPWLRESGRARRAGVSAFGFGGTNAHLVLQEAPAVGRTDDRATPQLFTLSARDPAALERYRQQTIDWLADRGCTANLDQLSYTAAKGRKVFPYRLAVVAQTTGELAAALSKASATQARSGGKTAWVFTGQGAQYEGMAQGLYDHDPAFREAVDHCCRAIPEREMLPIAGWLSGNLPMAEALTRASSLQPLLFTVQYALAAAWRRAGGKPDVLLGHSLGEYVAACLADVMSLETAMAMVCLRGRLLDSLPAGGGMLAVQAPAATVRTYLSDGFALEVAADNGPQQVVVSGEVEELSRLKQALAKAQVESVALPVTHAFHSRLMDPILDAFESGLSHFSYRPPAIPLLSNLNGRPLERAPDARYWRDHLRQSVQFCAMTEQLPSLGVGHALEIGPKPLLSGLVGRVLARGCVPGLVEAESGHTAWLRQVGHAFCTGMLADTGGLFAQGQRLAFPGYPFSRSRFWAVQETGQAERLLHARRQLLGRHSDSRRCPARPRHRTADGADDENAHLGRSGRCHCRGTGSRSGKRGESMNDVLSTQARALLERRLAGRKSDSAATRHPVLRPDQPNRYAPFPLNDMQQAYWIGRQGDDQTGMHYYMERRTADLDFSRFCQAWERMVARHDMLRVVISAAGLQRIREHEPGAGLPQRHDLRYLSAREQEEALSVMREALAHHKADLTQWPHHQLHWCDLGDGQGCLLMSLDIWCIDGQSIQTLINELACSYADPGCALPALSMTFRDYVLASQAFEQGPAYAQALDYWRQRLAHLPAAPSLPLASSTEVSSPPTFARCDMTLTESQTQAIRTLVADQGLTLATLLAACYAEVLARWSGSRHFVLNMPRFNRKPIHPDIYSVLGEFATFTLLEVTLNNRLSFGERVAATQEQLWLDMEHDAVSGVRVLRELNQHNGGRNHAPAPIVFTSLPEIVSGSDNLRSEAAALGELTFSLSQTPQVWLDCQYYQVAGRLHLNWDYLAGRFPVGMVEDMFRAFSDLVQRLAAANGALLLRETSVVALPVEQLTQRRAANATERTWPQVSLAKRLLLAATRWSDNLALVADGQSLSYRQLFERAGALAELLRRERGRVAIRLGKGVDQIIATVACLLARRCYVPLDIELPAQRQCAIAERARAELVLTHDWLPVWGGIGRALAASQWPCSQTKPPVDDRPWIGDAEIYLLFTSGSTGEPKGVPITQRGVINLLEHNAKWLGLTASDRVFGVSALHHDMSVAELLPCLTQGAALILPGHAERRDPGRWLALMQAHRVTYWSSVPALAEMLLERADQQQAVLDTLRQVTLGGDWLPPSISQRFRCVAPNATVHSIGGPTEITVWNITHTLQPNDDLRATIPYGKPISNSRLYIVDEDGEDCPVWVCGEMVCAGDGVSPGYLEQDPSRPNAFGPLDGRETHCYRTGDLGRYMPDGSIEFVGRRDSQVKLHGVRIELGEIEGVLQRHPAVNRAVVELRHTPHARLVAWFDGEVDAEVLRAHASAHLPAPLVPSSWQCCDVWPISANGKVDRRALSARPLQAEAPSATQYLQGSLEQWLADCWAQVLQQTVVSREANFFHLGGDSLLAARMLGTIEAQSGVRLPVQQIFATPTLSRLAEQIEHQLTAQGRSANGWNPIASAGFPPRDTQAAPLSWSQRGLWLIEQRQPGTAAYTLPLFFALDGPLDVANLCNAVNAVLAGHEILRSRFGFDSAELRPYLLPDAAPPQIQVTTLSPGEDISAWLVGRRPDAADCGGLRRAVERPSHRAARAPIRRLCELATWAGG